MVVHLGSVVLAAPFVSFVVGHLCRYSLDRNSRRFLWRVYEASDYDDRHLRAASVALHRIHQFERDG